MRVKRKPRGALVSNNNGSQSNDDTALPVAVDTATVPPPAQEQQKSSRADEVRARALCVTVCGPLVHSACDCLRGLSIRVWPCVKHC